MANKIFEKWDNAVDLKGLQEDIEKASEGGNREFEEVPYGAYEVKVNKIELKPTKKSGDPMVSIWFDIVNGDYKGQKIFMNQVITQGFQIHLMDDFLKSLDTGVDVHFDSYTQYAEMLLDIAEACDSQKLEYALNYRENKGYSVFTITEVFEG